MPALAAGGGGGDEHISFTKCHQRSRSAKASVSALNSSKRHHSASKSCAIHNSTRSVAVHRRA
eukprot:COSAG01_NODE_2654_length_7306_cov_60.980991_2_plen_63_part_00